MRVRGYAAGTPCFTELNSPDVDTAVVFYRGLFGWDTASVGDRLGFLHNGYPVAGITDLVAGPPAWLVTIATDDLSATAAAVAAHDGQVLHPPTDLQRLGRRAIFRDPAGAVFAGWQRGTFAGSHFAMEPGAPCWYELATPRLSVAESFYREVFDWEAKLAESAPGDPYFDWQLKGDAIGGLVPIDHRFPQGVPAHWTACFTVEDCAAICDLAVELGGSIPRKPMPIAAGWYARVTDPTGASFAVIEVSETLRAGLGF